MSVLYTSDLGYFIDHDVFIKETYKNFKFREVFFDIRTKFRKDLEAQKFARRMESCSENNLSHRKRKKPASEPRDSEWLNIRNSFEQILTSIQLQGFLDHQVTILDVRENNGEARKAVSDFFSTTAAFRFQEKTFWGVNDLSSPCKRLISNENFVLPANSKFYNAEVQYLNALLTAGNKYSLVVIDPPWTNKHIKRRKKTNESSAYLAMENEDLLTLPIEGLCKEGALVAVWCTNSQKHLKFLKQELLPNWELRLVAEWYWVKVTKSGEPVTDWNDSNGKQPYERILLARRKDSTPSTTPDPESGKLVVSVPSAIHSFKPPLTDVLKPYIKHGPCYLEVFARSLVPGGTSVGNQVVLLQHSSLFEKFCSDTNAD